jgi:tRNA-dihydrouridine synthase A
MIDYRFSVAPMMDWTDRHCRVFHRTLSRRALLYTEMVTAEALVHGSVPNLLRFDPCEHPIALQLGGSDPEKLRFATQLAVAYGYDEINLNVGCPSERVQSGAFGACLMREPDLVADCLSAMREAAGDKPVTVKHRIGVDDDVPEDRLFGFVETLKRAGTRVFIVHARKAILKGLSPKENRQVPPLDYALVATLKRAHPDLTIVLNGGIETLAEASAHLAAGFDGVMMGRAAYHTPALLGEVDAALFGEAGRIDPYQALEHYRPYMAEQLAGGVPLHAMTRHMLGLFHGVPGARGWRRVLSERANRSGAGLDVLDAALSEIADRQAAQ